MDDSYKDSLVNARPAVAPAIGQAPAGGINFPGVGKPSSDFQAVRDGRRSTLLGYLVDLSTARSFAAGTALLLPLEGNVFQSDPLYDLTGSSTAGIARVHFQDQNTNPVGTYVTALPGAIYRVPATQVAIENYAQAGKFLYLVYGVDVDLIPGQSQQLQILGNVSVAGSLGQLAQQLIGGVNELVVMERGFTYGASFASVTAKAANTPETILAPASNVNGVIVWAASGHAINNANADPQPTIIAKTSAPASAIDGDVLASSQFSPVETGTDRHSGFQLERPVFVAAGKGLYYIVTNTEVAAHRRVLYTAL